MNLKLSPCDLEKIIEKALESGAVAAGFTSLAPDSKDQKIYKNWINNGFHAGMQYMVTGEEPRFNPEMVLEGSRSALCTAYSYAPADKSDTHPLFSDYARGEDYHHALRRRLTDVAALMETMIPGSRTRICIDSAPVRERFLAARAGIGTFTRSGLLYVPGAGTQVFLAEILWTHPVENSVKISIENPCAECNICALSCPGGAIRGDGTVDARRCLSYLTIEHKDELPDNLRLPHRIYGCDVCARVCPLNKCTSPALPEFRLAPGMKGITEATLQDMGTSAYRRLSSGTAFSRIPLARLLRNLKRH